MTDGTLVRIRGRVRVYAKGTIQLTMSAIDPSFTLGLLGLDRDGSSPPSGPRACSTPIPGSRWTSCRSTWR